LYVNVAIPLLFSMFVESYGHLNIFFSSFMCKCLEYRFFLCTFETTGMLCFVYRITCCLPRGPASAPRRLESSGAIL